MYVCSRRRFALVLTVACALSPLLPGVPADAAVRPPNDDFASSVAVSGSAFVTGSLTGATVQAGEPVADSGSGTIWWTWTAPSDGTWRFSVEPSGQGLTAWSGTAVDQLTPATTSYCRAGAAGGPYIRATAGQQVRLRVHGWDGAVTLSWSPASRPANDSFTAAVSISGYNGETPTSTCLASRETGEQSTVASEHTVWFRWPAPDRVRWCSAQGRTRRW